VILGLHHWPTPLQAFASLCLGHEPKARVVTCFFHKTYNLILLDVLMPKNDIYFYIHHPSFILVRVGPPPFVLVE
jgi:hypothetical protein